MFEISQPVPNIAHCITNDIASRIIMVYIMKWSILNLHNTYPRSHLDGQAVVCVLIVAIVSNLGNHAIMALYCTLNNNAISYKSALGSGVIHWMACITCNLSCQRLVWNISRD